MFIKMDALLWLENIDNFFVSDQSKVYEKTATELKKFIYVIVLLKTHWLSSRRQKRVAKFRRKYVGSFRLLKVVNSNLNIDVESNRTKVNLYQIRVCKFKNNTECSRMLSGESHFPRSHNSSTYPYFTLQHLSNTNDRSSRNFD